MGCNHKYAIVVIAWAAKRSQSPPSIVTEDTHTLYRCPRCSAVRIDSQNEFCYSKGKFVGQSRLNRDLE